MMQESSVKILIVIWIVLGVELSLYLALFPIFMRKKIAKVTNLLEDILKCLKKDGA
ncbi:MAG: hypothetical protein KKF93_01680 [Candidatus Omnitrophica bacterium]|nr:hypothetical protein [Candidatus Omnitrophota bacterium]